MGKRLILHIGGGKCGSSAIQDYLAANHAKMMQNGVLTPDQTLGTKGPFKSEQIFFFENLDLTHNATEVLREKFANLLGFMNKKGQHTLIVSAENLSQLSFVPAVLARVVLSIFDDVRVVFYVRRQDDYMISAWQQWGLKTYRDIITYIDEEARPMADWAALLAPWEAAFGPDRLIVRPFQRNRMVDGDVVEDFLSVLNLPHKGCIPLSKLSNRSFDEHLGDMAHRIRDVFDGPHDNRMYDVMVRVLGDPIFKTQSGSHLLTLSDRLKILEQYATGNEEIKERYLPELGDEPLFKPPTAKDVITLDDIDKLRGENEVLLRMFYVLTAKFEKLTRKPPRHSLKYLIKTRLGLIPRDEHDI